MFEVKKGDAFKTYFKLVDSTDFATPENGVTSGDVTGAFTKNGGAAVNLDMAAANRWTDLSGSVSGLYVVTVPVTAVDTIGELIVAIIDDGGGVAGCPRVFKVVSHPSDDIYNKVSAVDDQLSQIINNGVAVATFYPGASAILADAVWDKAKSSHVGANTFGKILQDVETKVSVVDNQLSQIINNGVAVATFYPGASTILQDACSVALQNLELHRLMASTVSLANHVELSSAIGKLLDNGGAWTYDRTADALEVLGAAAGGTDWSTKEQNAIKKVLGVSAGSSVPWNPTTGILDTIDNQISTLLADNNSLSSAIATVDNQLSTVLQDIDTLSSAIQTVDNEISTIDNQVSTLLQGNNALSSAMVTIDNQISTILQDIDTLSSAIQIVDNEVSTANDKLDVVDNQISTLLQDNNSLSSAIAAVDNQVSTILQDIDTLSSAIQTVDNEVSTANDKLDVIDNQISTVLQDNNSLSSAIATVDNQVSTVLQDLDSLSSAIQTVDNEVSTANDGINALSNVVNNTGVAFHASSISHASSHLLHQAHVTVGQTGDFSTVAGSLRLARSQAIGDWTVAADALDVMDIDGTSQKSLTLTPGGGPYTARA